MRVPEQAGSDAMVRLGSEDTTLCPRLLSRPVITKQKSLEAMRRNCLR